MKKRNPPRRQHVKNSVPFDGQRRRSTAVVLGVFIVAGLLAAGAALFFYPRSGASDVRPDAVTMTKSGRELAETYCQMCHLFPEPELLPRNIWRERTLPEMKIRLGLNPAALEQHPESKYAKATGAFTDKPLLRVEEWNRIEAYYLSSAPEKTQSAGKVDRIELQLPGFAVEVPGDRHDCPATSLIFIDEAHRQILAGDAKRKLFRVFDSNGVLQQTMGMDVPVSVSQTEQGIYITSIGSFMPSDIPSGTVSFLAREGDGYGLPQKILSGLPRPTHSSFADLNSDGRKDLVVSMYGHNSGRLSWFENLGENKFKEHVLLNRSGAIQTALEDLDGDGSMEILALVAQEFEGLLVFSNNGANDFISKPIFQKNPSFGHTHFELADFNFDGKPDLLIVNGDNGEYASPLKPFHGLRIYLNRGNGQFEEAFFFPMNGAYRAVVADFDEDHDLDIAAVSYFPDYNQEPREGFIYLESRGGLSFHPSTFPEVAEGRWITLDSGDLDGDGDLDLVLGSNGHGPTRVPQDLFDRWENNGPAFITLRNRLR